MASFGHLPHRVIAVVGPMAAGKSVVTRRIQEILTIQGAHVQSIHMLDDLYVPYAERYGRVLNRSMSRVEITDTIQWIYEREGRDAGTTLLMRLLERMPPDGGRGWKTKP